MNKNNTNKMQVTKSLAMSMELTGAIICIKGTDIGSMISLPSDKKMIVGRDPTVSNYVINHPKISRKHFEITYIGSLNKYLIVDYSRNGIFLQDGSRLEKEREYYLSPMTELSMGDGSNIYKLR